ncbi:wax alcohol acyltransferase 2 [Seminavis robusta]|uniref:Acyltransferase n=1 Tax=Seminavis robusta TaxID=568900 RepID=A0A9N8D927_9STRA|nr:wax alcohol acyltransferase 2 [Seminavis robusta]|eukprot:Sro43_g025900.1 wax alcohol acyltransferase 2 (342) ;mRNA; r:8665-9690
MPPKTVKALAPDPTKVTAAEKILGAGAIFLFVSTWIASIFSPFILASSLWKGQYVRTGGIILITILAYLPWEKGNLAADAHNVIYGYFPLYFKSLSLEFEGDELPPEATNNNSPDNNKSKQKHQQTFYAIHPHGAFSFGWATLFCHLQNVRFCFAPPLFASPFFRLFTRIVGKPGSAGKAAMISYMRKGEDLALPPGGFEEATLTCPGKDRVYIKTRAGFVKLCLQHGIAIRPVYVFGEHGLYWNIQGAWDFRINTLNKKMGMPAIVTWGHPLVPLLPRNTVDMKIVVGAPIELPKIETPTKEEVSKWHSKYMTALQKLYEDHKEAAYGSEVAKTSKLEVW